jgi:hypothetical protein
MNSLELLNCRRLPARLDAEQTAILLGFRLEPDIQVLMRAKLLKPLGAPAQNGIKYFATSQIQAFATDPEWLHKASGAVQRFWRSKHAKSAPAVLAA